MRNVWLVLLCCIFQSQAQNKLEIDIENITISQGTLVVSIFNSAKSFDQNEVQEGFFQKIVVGSSQLQVVFENLPTGRYAIKAYHDANDNQKLDKTWMGIPKESYGFSNNIMGIMGPPSFEQSAFEVDSNTQHTLILR